MSYQVDENPFLPEDGARWVEGNTAPDDVPAPTLSVVPDRSSKVEAPAGSVSAAQHVSAFEERIIAELELRLEFGDDAAGGEALGFSEVDDELVIEAGKLIVLAAREGVGKTAFGLQTARTIATRLSSLTGQGGKVVYYITEMGVQETVERVVVSFAQLPANKLKRGVTADIVAAVRKAFGLLRDSGLFIVNAAGWTVDELVRDARAFKAAHDDLRAVFVDNLTGIAAAPNMRSRSQWEGIGDTCEKLNMLTMTDKGISAPVVLLAHLKRPDKLHVGKEPVSMDLAGSDLINRWANSIVLLHEKTDEQRAAAATAAADPERQAPRSVGGFGGGGAAATQLTGFEEPTWTTGDGEQWRQSEVGRADADCSHLMLVTKNRGGRKFRCDLNFIGAQMRFVDPKGHTVRPYDMPEAEPAARSEFRRRMLELGDL